MQPIWQLLLGILVGDFLVAAGHWFEDQYFDQHTPHIGTVGRDNVFHHYLPYAMTSFSPLEHTKITLPLTLASLALLYLVAPGFILKYPYMITVICLITVSSNALHSIQHERPCRQPSWFRVLSNLGILESSAQHKRHHLDPQHRYGVVLGWTNPIYDGLGVWRILELLVPLPKRSKPSYTELEQKLPDDIRTLVNQPCPHHIPKERIQSLRKHVLS